LDTFKRLRGPAIISVLLTVVPLLSSSAIVYFLIKNESTFGNLHWAEWAFVTLVFACTSMIALSPPTLLAMVYGYFLSALAIPYLFLLNMGAITAVYFLTKKGFGNSLESFIDGHPKSKRLLDQLKNDELRVVFLAKLSPVLPFALTNFVFALSGATFRNVFIGGFLAQTEQISKPCSKAPKRQIGNKSLYCYLWLFLRGELSELFGRLFPDLLYLIKIQWNINVLVGSFAHRKISLTVYRKANCLALHFPDVRSRDVP
jgi:hypothetical protein